MNYLLRVSCRWVINNDFDEYIYFPKRPIANLVDFLSKRARFDFISFGNTIYTHMICEEPEKIDSSHQPWAVERMVYRQKGPYCAQRNHGHAFDPNFCKHATGRRKYAMNPATMLGFLTPHAMLVMEGFNRGFYDGGNNTKKKTMSANYVVLAHYRHFISKPICSLDMATFSKTEGATYEYPASSQNASSVWERDLGVHNTVEQLRRRNPFL